VTEKRQSFVIGVCIFKNGIGIYSSVNEAQRIALYKMERKEKGIIINCFVCNMYLYFNKKNQRQNYTKIK